MAVGSLWDPSQANAVFNLEQLKKEIAAKPHLTFRGVAVSGSSEVYQAAQSLVQQGIGAFTLVPDNIVYSAFESIVKAADSRKIPIFINDVERLEDGALAACGYDYAQSGIQAAHLVDRIIKGENPADIPFERYKKITVGVNLRVAEKLGITVPQSVLDQAGVIIGGEKKAVKPKRLALFVYSDTHVLKIATDGVMDEFKESGILEKHNISVDFKNAQNDHATAQAIVQDMVRQNYDYIVTASSLALQATANGNKIIPHIFGAVTDPYRMGIAKSPTDHIPNITGVATFQPVEATIRFMRAIFPQAKTIGMIWNPSEANSEACTLKARAAAKQYGFKLMEKNVTAPDEIKDALAALINKKIDLFFTSGDNTVILAHATVAAILQDHRIPYFTNDPTDIERGSFCGIGADYYEVGREMAKMAMRVIHGEAPKAIPIKEFAPEKIGIHLGLAKSYGVSIPGELIKKAAVVKR
jgi:putative ABC transport system permease protein